MYGKIYPSMFTGSMCGSGAIVFAVFTYAITNARPDCGSLVSLNPIALSGIIGEDPDQIEQAIKELCCPDHNSRSKAEEGRRLVRVGNSMDYKVVNLEKYRFLDNEDQKAYWRERKREQRAKLESQVADNKDLSGTVKDSQGQTGKCPHAEADADPNADAKKRGSGSGPPLSAVERIGLEKERDRKAAIVKRIREQDFKSAEDVVALKAAKARIDAIDAATHIPL